MTRELRYGAGSKIQIELPPEVVVADCAAPRGLPLDDPAAAVAAALADPLDFPPLARATVPGDRIVLAVDQGTPQVQSVLAGVVHSLLQGQTQPSDITVVQAPANGTQTPQEPTALLPRKVRRAIEVQTHDPNDSVSLSYLAASKSGRPIYLNRALCDADVVLPIGSLRLESSLGYMGIHSGLFPAFSDEETRQRFHAPSSANWAAHQRRRREEADEAAWLLGVQFTLQIVPGPGDTILHVLAGDANAIAVRGRQLCEAAWLYQVPQRASLVVATIEGGPSQQTWENIARALFAALQAVTEDGSIVLCTELQCLPGPALKRLTVPDSDDAVIRQIRRDRSPDAVPACLLIEARGRNRVYLLSGLEEEVVENLGLGHVARGEEVARLTRQHDSCILLSNAQHAVLAAAAAESR